MIQVGRFGDVTDAWMTRHLRIQRWLTMVKRGGEREEFAMTALYSRQHFCAVLIRCCMSHNYYFVFLITDIVP